MVTLRRSAKGMGRYEFPARAVNAEVITVLGVADASIFTL